MRLLTAMILFSLLSACSPGTGTHEGYQSTGQDSLALRYLKEVEWPKAYREQDTLLLDRILAREFQMIEASGNVTNKQFELKWIKANASAPDSFFYEIKRLEFFENATAMVSGTGHIFDDQTYTVYQSSNVFIKRDHVWQAIASHVSGVTSKPWVK